MKISILDIIDGTVVDGVGFRISVYAAGCPHQCPGCHNPQSWEIANGTFMETAEVFKIIQNSPWNVTFSGGDPFSQVMPFTELAKMIKEKTAKSIWCYTGYRYEEILSNQPENGQELLKFVDVLVDGTFENAGKDTSLKFRGSSNQRIIDVKQSLCNKEIRELAL